MCGGKRGGPKSHPTLRTGGGRELEKEAKKQQLGGWGEEQVGGGH